MNPVTTVNSLIGSTWRAVNNVREGQGDPRGLAVLSNHLEFVLASTNDLPKEVSWLAREVSHIAKDLSDQK